jgi:DNA-binding response OmpR family regulator
MLIVGYIKKAESRHPISHVVQKMQPNSETLAIAKSRILLVDDNEPLRKMLALALEHNGFEVVMASNVNDALKLIGAEHFDVLLSDLQMPNAGDGLTVVSAMHHSNPKAVTLILSGYPEMKAAAAAILLQTDEVLTKPISPIALAEIIRGRLKLETQEARPIESVATILARETQATIDAWLARVDQEGDVLSIPMDHAMRSAYLPQLFLDLVSRLQKPLPLGTRALVSESAAKHGKLRRDQGYTPAMMVEESRMLQVSIFQTLEHNLTSVDFNRLLGDVMAIADEVDSQLAQQMAAYITESKKDGKEVAA